MKNYWVFIIIGWALFALIIYCQSDLELNEKIEAWSILSLVSITLYYAIQTQNLVEEEKQNRIAEFWEKRILDFYKPFIDRLEDIKIELRKKGGNGESIINKLDDLYNFFQI